MSIWKRLTIGFDIPIVYQKLPNRRYVKPSRLLVYAGAGMISFVCGSRVIQPLSYFVDNR